MARVLFFGINGDGLGHVTRILAVARQIRKQAPNNEILVLTSSEYSHALGREGFASVKVPSPESMAWDKRIPAVQLAHSITTQVIATFRPHVLVVDSIPAGLFSEYLSPLMIVPKRVFIFCPFPHIYSELRHKIALSLYGRILMPFTEEEREHVKVDFGDRAVWVGDILVRSMDEILPRDEARRRIGIGLDEFVVYVGLGGGGNPKNSEVLTWILGLLSQYPDIKIACGLQPLAKSHDVLFEHENCFPVAHFPMMEYFSAFDLAVSASGANSAELVYAGLSSILIPFGYPSTDQDFNADRFARKDLARKVAPLDSDGFRSAFDDLLIEENRRRMSDGMTAWSGPNGAEKAAESILQFLQS